ncbi:hypothetical protein NA57DRAFT_25192, partial [Rhizodiscina lignyota]
KLTELITAANLQYGLKNYAAAADSYSSAVEMQDELNGEMNPQNADLFYRYGRCLYKLAVAKSDVLGGKVAGEKKKEKKQKGAANNGEGSSSALPTKEEKVAEEPYFNLTGMENWESDEEDEDEDGEAEDEEDDFANAYEILDIARILFAKQLEAIDAPDSTNGAAAKGKGKALITDMSPEVRKVKELLADTHDLQAEISLENERFHDAIPDSRESLAIKQELYPKESELIAEAHYKLSLALEFSSVNAIREAQAQESSEGGAAAAQQKSQEPQVDEEMRKEAVVEMEAAIESCRLRVAKEEKELTDLKSEKRTDKEKKIKDVKEMIEDMEQRLVDLRNPAVTVTGAMGGPAGAPDPSNPLAGILGQLLGESPVDQKARIEEATKTANDLTGLVRHRK